MRERLEDLGWPEAELLDMSFAEGVLKFKMLDLLSYSDPLSYEVVEVVVKEIEALRIAFTPYRNGRFEVREIPVQIGAPRDSDEGFEGVCFTNPFSDTPAEQFWVSGDLRAADVSIRRTGQVVFKQRGC
jgi:hypothetical protein